MQTLVFIFVLLPSFLFEYYVTTYAGGSKPAYADGQGTKASFNNPIGIITDQFGNLFVADNANHMIRKINSTGYVSTVAGDGTAGYSNGQGVTASFNFPSDVAVDLFGNIFVTDNRNNMIRMINATGYVSTLAGNGLASFADGQDIAAAFNIPYKLTVDKIGNIIVSEMNRIRRINSTGYVVTVAGNGNHTLFSDGQDVKASFNYPLGLAIDYFGNIFVADCFNYRIRKINTTGYVSTFAGNGSHLFFDGQGTEAAIFGPSGITIDSFGNLFVSDSYNLRIRKINSSGYVTTIAGTGNNGFLNGIGSVAVFDNPQGITVNDIGEIFVADSNNNKIRKLQYQSTTIGSLLPTSTINSPFAIVSSTTNSLSITTFANNILSSGESSFDKDPSVKALILVFTGPSNTNNFYSDNSAAYIMIVLGGMCGILFARQRVKKDEAIRLQERYSNKRQNIQIR